MHDTNPIADTDDATRPPGDGTPHGDVRWLSYDELAAALGVKRASAVRTAFRHRWQRRQGNDQTARVAVPLSVLDGNRKPPAPGAAHGNKARSSHDRSLSVIALDKTIGVLREELALAEARAQAEHARADRAEMRVDTADADRRAAISLADQSVAMLADAASRGDRAEDALTAERNRADTLRDRLNAQLVAAETTEAHAAVLRDRLDAMQAQLADAHAALQAAEAADARAGRAETARTEEQARADALRAQIDALNAEMAATGAAADRAMAHERMRADRLSAQVEALSAEVMRADAAGRDKERAEADRDAERARADTLRDRIEALQEQLAARPEGGGATEAIRRAEAMVDNLREAHAGEVSALKAERHRLAAQIDGFATRADQAEARTDSLRARVDVLQRERDTARADAERSGAEAKEAHAETDAMWQAEATRKARGRLRRAWDGWRGR